jgi:hypothetical protein
MFRLNYIILTSICGVVTCCSTPQSSPPNLQRRNPVDSVHLGKTDNRSAELIIRCHPDDTMVEASDISFLLGFEKGSQAPESPIILVQWPPASAKYPIRRMYEASYKEILHFQKLEPCDNAKSAIRYAVGIGIQVDYAPSVFVIPGEYTYRLCVTSSHVSHGRSKEMFFKTDWLIVFNSDSGGLKVSVREDSP